MIGCCCEEKPPYNSIERLRGRLSGFPADRLFAILNRLGQSVEIRISAKEQAPEKTHTRVMIG